MGQEFGYKTIKKRETEHFNCRSKEIVKKKIVLKYQVMHAAVCGMYSGLCCGIGERSNTNKSRNK